MALYWLELGTGQGIPNFDSTLLLSAANHWRVCREGGNQSAPLSVASKG